MIRKLGLIKNYFKIDMLKLDYKSLELKLAS